jgi:hypothetical protein
MSLNLPFWFPLRQGKAEPVGPDVYRLTAPNLAEAFISIHQASKGRWSAALRKAADGPEIASTEAEFTSPYEAWEAAFELYRQHVVT